MRSGVVRFKTAHSEVPGSRVASVNRATGEVIGYTAKFRQRVFDATPFVKVYGEGLDAVLSLKSTGQVVMKALVRMMMASKNTAEFNLSRQDIGAIGFPMSPANYHRGVNELIKLGLITRVSSRTGRVAVNRLLLWNGDRSKA